MANLRYFNPAIPGTLTTANAASGTYHRKMTIKSTSSKCIVKNNYNIGCKVKIYAVVPKHTTNTPPLTAFTNGMADQGNPTSNSPNIYLTDSTQFKDLFKIADTKSATLLPGQEMSCTYYSKSFTFDPAEFDALSDNYNPDWKSVIYIVRIEGLLSHDAGTDNLRGLNNSKVDVLTKTKIVISYDSGGVALNDYSVSDGYNTFIGAATNNQITSEFAQQSRT